MRRNRDYGIWLVLPQTAMLILLFLFVLGMEGATNLHKAVVDHSFLHWPTGLIPWGLVVLYCADLFYFLRPVLELSRAESRNNKNFERWKRLAPKRLKHLVVFSVVQSVALLFAYDFLVAMVQMQTSSGAPFTPLKMLVNLGSGLFLGVLLHFVAENALFPVKRRIRLCVPDLPLPYQSLYFKMFLILAAVTAHLVVQSMAVLPSFLMVDRPINAAELLNRAADPDTSQFWMHKNSEVLFNAERYGAKGVLEVFLVQMAVYLGLIVLLVSQIKLLIKRPLRTIAGRLRDLNLGRPEDLSSIEVIQNDEFAEVFGEINHLISTQKSALHASQERLSHIVAGAADPIIVFDARGRIQLFNPAAEQFFGYSADEARNMVFRSLVELPEAVSCACEVSALPMIEYLLSQTEGLSRQQGLLKDGTRRPFESNLSTTQTADGPLYTAILRDISAQLALEETLTRAKVEAETANRMKSEFLANMSHELRTPLNAVLGYTQLLSSDRNLTQGQLDKIQTISRSGEHLLALINDILDLSKIEAGKFELHETVFDLPAFIQDLKVMFELRAQKKNLNLDVEILDGLPQFVRGDIGKLRQVLINLVGNALKFTSEGGIGIVVGLEDNEVRFSVNDSGKGIPQNELDLILQPFMQSSNTDHEGGTGLGLAISHRFINLMGGRLEIESQVDVGSTFSFHLPMEPAEPVVEVKEPEWSAVAVRSGTEATALIVDDKETNRLILKEMLEGVGFSTVEAENGQAALDLARAVQPDVVLMDIKMPVMDGYEAVSRMKADPDLKAIPVFALTASAFKHDEARITEAGFNGYLAKPFKQSSLFRLIRDKSSIQLEYEVATEDHPEVGLALESWETIANVLGPQGLTSLDDMTLINDFTAIQRWADQWTSTLPGWTAWVKQKAFSFDEAALQNSLVELTKAKEPS